MKEFWNENRRGGTKILLVVLIIVGTGCFNVLLWKQNNQMEKLEKTWASYLVEQGFGSVGYAEYITQQSQTGKWTAWLEQIPMIDYLVNNQGNLEPAAQKSVTGMAALYPGKNNKSVFWSGAASEKAVETRLFQNLDENILLANKEEQKKKEEEEDLEAAAIKENEQVAGKAEDSKSSQEEAAEEKEAKEASSAISSKEGLQANLKKINQLESSLNTNYLLRNFYIVDSSTSVNHKIFDVEKLLNTSLSLKKKNEPQILIYHTHGASERFIDSRADKKEDSIVGVGGVLADLLTEKYGYQVIHDEKEYDRIQGKIDRNKAYNKAYAGITKQLKENPQIQVMIDLHRDGVGNKVQRTTTVNGKRTAQVMFFNGLSRNRTSDIKYLPNENITDNLAFSLQMKLKCMEKYPDFAKPVYLKSYRYNLHLRKRSVLVELGNENNTLEEAKNAMKPLADVINQVLSGE